MALSDVIARLAVSLTMETAAFQEGATITEKRTAQLQKKLQSFGDKIVGIGSKLSIGLTAPLIAFGAASVKAAQESAEAMGQVDAALKSMGDAAGRTREQLAALADGQMRTSLYDDDEILRSVTANLLTFGKISGTAFDQAQQAAIDLSARLGTDLQGSALMVGKALNDPIKGVTALTRVGVSFTEQQKEQITKMAEAGNVAGAQAMILAELQKQYGGAAQAMRDADPAAAAKMQFADLQEEVGERLIPVLTRLMEMAVKVLDWFDKLSPATKDTVVAIAAVAAAVGPVLMVFGSLISVGAPLLAFLGSLGPVLSIVGKALLLIGLNPVVLALAAVIGGIYLAWKNWDKIEPILRNLYEGAKKWIVEGLGWVLKWVLNPIATVKEAFFKLYDAVVGHSYIPDMVDGIATEMKRLDAVMVAPVTKATSKAQEAFRAMAQEARAIMDRLFPEAAARIKYETERATLNATGASEAALRALAEERDRNKPQKEGVIFGETGGSIATVQEGLKSFEDFVDRLEKKSKDATVRIAKSFKDMADETLSAIDSLSNAVKSGGFMGILQAVIGLGLQLGSIGAFGSTIASRINATASPTAAPTIGGVQSTLPSTRGSVARAPLVEVIPSPYFNVAVNGQIQAAAPSIASAGTQGALSRMAFTRSRSLST